MIKGSVSLGLVYERGWTKDFSRSSDPCLYLLRRPLDGAYFRSAAAVAADFFCRGMLIIVAK